MESTPLPTDRIEPELLDRYLTGQCTEDEHARVAAWMAAVPHRRLGQSFRFGTDLPQGEVDTALERTWRVLAGDNPPASTATTRQPRIASIRPLRWAALTAGLCAIVVTAWQGFTRSDVSPATGATKQFATPNGRRAAVTLADGTRVLLNAGSTLRVSHDLTRTRVVELDGEAQFTVTHRGSTPFVVKAGAARVTVLGTAFTVRRYPEDRQVRVVVTNGRVSLGATDARRPVVLDANTIGALTDSGQVVITQDADAARFADWTRGRIVFRKTPLREAFPMLERHYGLVIRVTDTALADKRLTATVTDDPPTAVLDVIAQTMGARYVREGNTVTFFTASARAPRARRDLSPITSEKSHGR